MSYVVKSTCTSCLAYCPINVTMDDGHVVKVEGNPEAPLYGGFICPKGRALAATHNAPNRLKNSLKRMPDGSYQPISSAQLVEEISVKLREIIRDHGVEAVAAYLGNPSAQQQASSPMMLSFLAALGSDRFFTNATIDQPGTVIAGALHGGWAGGHMRPETWDMFMIVGGNPVISKQYFPQNPGSQLKGLVRQGTKLIVIDPRRTETARRAHIHLQCIPGEDPTIIGGLIHLVIENGKVDRAFTELNTTGFDQLRQAVKPFTPDYVAERAGISETALREAADIIGEAKAGDFGSGVGPSMATRGTLTAYLIFCLQSLRGLWAAAGDEAARPKVLMSRAQFKAQPNPPRPGWGFGRQMRIRGLGQTAAGMPTGALPEEILTPGQGQIRALFLNTGAMLTWPQQDLTKRALESLDLLIVHDVEAELSATARMAHYVIATKLQFEIPFMSQYGEVVSDIHKGYGWIEPFASYQPALLTPPEDVDVLESWQIYYRVAQRLGLQLKAGRPFEDPETAPPMDMTREPTTDDIYEMTCRDSVVALCEVKKYPNGRLFDEAREFVLPRDEDCTARMELANPDMLEELRQVGAESPIARRGTTAEFPFLYITRRVQNTTGSVPRPASIMKTSYNPAYMHEDDLKALGLQPGDMVKIKSRHGGIIGIVEADNDLRRGLLSMCYGFGKNPGEDYDPRRDGANVNRLIHFEDDYDRYNGMPRMSALPVSITPTHRRVASRPLGSPEGKQ